MTSSHPMPAQCQWFSRLAAALDRRSAPRLALLFLGAVLARGRRTVTTWIRAAGLSEQFRPCYTAVAAAGQMAFYLRSLGRVDGGERRRQELRGEGPQQMRLAVEQIRQRLRAQRPGHKIGHTPPGIGDAARPTARVAGASLGKASARVACAGQDGIRIMYLTFLDSGFGKQRETASTRRIGNDFRHRRGSGEKRGKGGIDHISS